MTSTLIDEIRQEMNQVHGSKSWATVAGFMGKSSAYALRVVRGDLQPSEDAMDAWIRNYRKQYAGRESVRICPTCGVAHIVGDCHGKTGHPVILAENEEVRPVVIRPKVKRPKRLRREMTTAQAAIWDTLSKEEKDTMLGITE